MMEREDMATALHAVFDKGIEVNLNTEDFEIIKISEEEQYPETHTHFFDWAAIFAEEGNISHGDMHDYMNFFNKFEMRKYFYENDSPLYLSYDRIVKSTGQWERACCIVIKSVKWTNENPIVIIGVSKLGVLA